VGGHYRFVNGSVNNDGKAVFFVGTSDQEISTTGTEVFFDYLVVNKTAGNVALQNQVVINTTSGDVLQLINSGGLDLNGQRLQLNNDGGNILTTGGARTITSAVSGGEFYVDGNKTVTQSSSGTLTFSDSVTVEIGSSAFTGLDFGDGLSTVNGNLIINAGGFVSNHAPAYGTNSTLTYRGNATFNMDVEWSSASLANVVVENGITLNTGTASSAISLSGNLTIESGAALTMGSTSNTLTVNGNLTNQGTITLSSGFGGDLYVEGNINHTGNFNSNERALFLTGSTEQAIEGNTITTDYLIVDNAAGIALNQNLEVSQGLTMTSGNITLSNDTLTLGQSDATPGTLTYTDGQVIGNFRRYFANTTNSGNASGLFPLGNSIGNNRHALVEFTAAPTAGGYLTAALEAEDMGLGGIIDTHGSYQINVGAIGSCTAFTVRSTDNEYWSIADDASLTGGTYTISLTMEDPDRLTSLCELRLLKRVGAGDWEAQGTHIEPSGSVAQPTISASGITGWSNFGFGGDGTLNPLPITLLGFSGYADQSGIHLEWEVAGAKDFMGFDIERMNLEGRFEKIGFVEYQAGQSHYQFADQALEGQGYYRLKLMDIDGSFEYSKVIYIEMPYGHTPGVTLMSNMGNGQLQLRATDGSPLDLRLLDIQGRSLGNWLGNAQSVAQAASQTLSVQSQGLYLIQARYQGRAYAWKYMKR
jgi:hypothetical protein